MKGQHNPSLKADLGLVKEFRDILHPSKGQVGSVQSKMIEYFLELIILKSSAGVPCLFQVSD